MWPGMTERFAIYDMDKTITRAATFGPFLTFAVPKIAPWRLALLPLVGLTTLAYGLKLIDRARLKEVNLGLMLGNRINAARLLEVSQGFAKATLAKNTLAPALRQIEADKNDGRVIILATASYQFYVTEIAALMGVDHVIATKATPDGAVIRPAIVGENCYGAAKLALVKNWFEQHKLNRSDSHVRFYSDHVSDAPCLEWADEAFATNPHPPLRALALQKGWTVLDWTKA
jgi:HAD superfamily hydrolase (TIGR01490 family)